MSRLTEKHKNKNNEDIYLFGGDFDIALEKLGQLEDIEEELGIDLITLFKVLRGEIWVSSEYHSSSCLYLSDDYVFNYTEGTIDVYEFDEYGNVTGIVESVRLEDYGKTWVLTKEELGNEKKKIIL